MNTNNNKAEVIETISLLGGNKATISHHGIGVICAVEDADGAMVDEKCFRTEDYARSWALGFNAHFE